jgi:hypothetical protein
MTEHTKNPEVPVKRYPRVLIPCRVIPGMFPGEWLVFIDAADPKNPGQTFEVQMFADGQDVSDLEGTPTPEQPVNAWVRVDRTKIENGLALILLPQFAQPVGTYLLIDNSKVREGAWI